MRMITPTGLMLGVFFIGASALGVLLSVFELFGPGYSRLLLGSYLLTWILATVIVLSVAVIVQASVRKRHGVFSHLKQSSTSELTGGDARAQR